MTSFMDKPLLYSVIKIDIFCSRFNWTQHKVRNGSFFFTFLRISISFPDKYLFLQQCKQILPAIGYHRFVFYVWVIPKQMEEATKENPISQIFEFKFHRFLLKNIFVGVVLETETSPFPLRVYIVIFYQLFAHFIKIFNCALSNTV